MRGRETLNTKMNIKKIQQALSNADLALNEHIHITKDINMTFSKHNWNQLSESSQRELKRRQAFEQFDPSSYKVDHQQAIKRIENNIKIARLRLQNNPSPKERTKINLSIQNSQKAIKKHRDAASGR